MNSHADPENPLHRLEDWEDFLEVRYPEPGVKGKDDYRKYDDTARDGVREFYRLNHRFQTHQFVQEKKKEYLSLNHRGMTVLDAVEFLNTLIDDSDPDTDL